VSEDQTCRDKLAFWVLLAEYCCGGKPLAEALSLIRGELAGKPMGAVAASLIPDLEGGLSFSQAMKRHSTVFSRAETCFVEGGELAGILDRALVLIVESSWRCPKCACWR
jgi:type IV pilus assembly protein PilC